ncbi:MAG: AMIN domain-containing protein, partial [Candidatus Atribacteria bacterium]|nr:AMIN domain-containing protein [Candidatus Atribacteria bacterium]
SAQNIWFTNIWYKKLPNYTHLTIKASGAISEYEVSYLEAPERIVIDVKNAAYSIDDLSKNILFLNMGSVMQVRCGQFESEPIPITRFIVDLFQKSDYEVKLSSDSRLLYIDVFDYTEFKAPEEQVFTVIPVKSEAVKIAKEEAPKISILDTYREPINLNIFQEDVVNVIRGLSELTGIDIMIHDTVTGQLTLSIKDKTFREAIELIMMSKELGYTEVSNTLIIAAKDVVAGYKQPITRVYELKNASSEAAKVILDGYVKEGAINIVADARMNTLIVTGTNEEIEKVEGIISTIDEELITRTFKIDNAIEKEEIDAIKSMLSIIIPEENRISIDSRQNEIIVEGTGEELENVAKIVAGLDKRAPQIMIEAKVIEITVDGEKDLGIRWSSGGDTKVEGQVTIGELTLGGSFERSGLIEATLKALQTEGKTNILSNPKVLTLDGKEAKILSGSKIPIRIITPEGLETVEYRDVGLSMTITPRLSSDGFITMDVNPKIESLGEELIQGYPVINSREERVIIRANLDETVVIGGLISSEDIKNITKIPFLSSIPIFGELFKFTHTKSKTTEIIILITT